MRRPSGDVKKGVTYLSLEIRGAIWCGERHTREVDIKRVVKTMNMVGNTQQREKSGGCENESWCSPILEATERSLGRT